MATTRSLSPNNSGKSIEVDLAAERERLRAEAAGVEKPSACVFCCHPTVWWNGSRERAVTVLLGVVVLDVAKIFCRRVRCAQCKKSWTLRPPWMTAQRQIQLSVVAMAVAKVMFAQQEPAKVRFVSQEAAAKVVRCSRRAVGRWVRWVDKSCPALRILAEVVNRGIGWVEQALAHQLEREVLFHLELATR